MGCLPVHIDVVSVEGSFAVSTTKMVSAPIAVKNWARSRPS